ncbi:unnamed protein product [Cylicocyclus nassatus]|uniref:Uncharacterized protein n=1 Tax=Cylicocyclus nassatus TaxID=53992 RepID=A0AA36DMR3_CYLNA|nr:unnamed protein product [Cylicocyclus nassatus]
MDRYAVVFFASPENPTSDVVSISDIIGTALVKRTVKVRWNDGKQYKAKILYIGTKHECERKAEQVTADGEIVEEFDIVPGTSVRSPSEDAASSLNEGEEENQALAEEILRRLPTQTAKSKNSDAIEYNFVSQEKVEQLRAMRSGNISQFVLDLEKLVYGDHSDVLNHVEDRLATADRMQFIEKCVYKYYAIPVEARAATWKLAKNALNSRARRNRKKSAPATSAEQSRTNNNNNSNIDVADENDPFLFDDDDDDDDDENEN